MNIKIEFIPNQFVGPFELGKPIQPYLELYPYLYREKAYKEGWDKFSFFDESVNVYVDDSNKITAIACSSNFYFNDFNLINSDISQTLELLSINKDSIESEKNWVSETEQQTVYEVDKFDMQLWVDENDKIVTVFVG